MSSIDCVHFVILCYSHCYLFSVICVSAKLNHFFNHCIYILLSSFLLYVVIFPLFNQVLLLWIKRYFTHNKGGFTINLFSISIFWTSHFKPTLLVMMLQRYTNIWTCLILNNELCSLLRRWMGTSYTFVWFLSSF